MHDAILKQHVNRDMVLSDREAAIAAEELRRQRGHDKFINVGGIIVEFDD